MAVYQDVLQARYEFIIGNSMTNLDIVFNKFQQLQRMVSNITGLKKVGTDLRAVGLGAKKSGAFFDLLSGKIVKTSEALRRLEMIKSKGSFFGKSAAQIGGIDDVSPAMNKPINEAQKLINSVGNAWNKKIANAPADMDKLAASTAKANNQVSIMGSQAKDIGVLMGLLFGGMTLQRWGNSLIRFVLPAMDKLEGYTSSGTKKVNAMNASFEFLKFSMFEAFTSTGLFKNFVEILINATNWLSELVGKYPQLTEIIALLGAPLVATGWLFQIVGGVFQMGMLWKVLSNHSTAAGALGAIGTANTKLSTFSTALSGIQKIVGVGLIVNATIDTFNLLLNEDLSAEQFWTDLAKIGIMTTLGAAFLGAGAFSIPIGVTVLVSILGFKLFKDAPKHLTMSEFGMSEEDWNEIQAIGPDKKMEDAFFKGFQGSVVPGYVKKSWEDLGDTIDFSIIDTMPNLGQSFITLNDTAVTELSTIDTKLNNVFSDRTYTVTRIEKTVKDKIYVPSISTKSTVSSVTGD